MKTKTIFANGLIVLVCAVSAMGTNGAPSVVTSTNAPAETDRQRLLHEDDQFRFVAIDYGNKGDQVPGFYVFAKQHSRWLRIDKVSTKDAVLGHSPTFEEAKQAGMSPASVDWDFRRFKDREFLDVPLPGGSFIAFPDKITLDERSQMYVLSFQSGWKIEGVETVLRFGKAHLVAAFNERYPNQASHAIGAEAAPQHQRRRSTTKDTPQENAWKRD